MYIDIEPPSLYGVFHSNKQEVDDMIFRTISNRPRGVGHSTNIHNDKDYKNPDRGLYVFSTMVKNDLTVIHNNNMVTGIRNKFNLSSNELHKEIINRIQKTSSHTSCSGVYVVETYTLYNEGSVNLKRILQYYMYQNGIEYPPEVTQDIVNDLYQKIVVNSYTPEIEIRVIIFIPGYEISRIGYVYVPGANIVIAQGDISNVAHPNSKVYKESGKYSNTRLGSTNINIEIVDNNVTPYYIKIGNDVVKLFSAKDSEKEQGGYLEITRGSTSIRDSNYKLEELKDIGIYKTMEEAKLNGDIRAEIELKKLTIEDKKLDYTRETLISNQQHQQQKIAAETKHLLVKHDIELAKRQIDMAIDISKFEISTTNMLVDNSTKFAFNLVKFKTDLYLTKEKARINNKLINSKNFNSSIKVIETLIKLI